MSVDDLNDFVKRYPTEHQATARANAMALLARMCPKCSAPGVKLTGQKCGTQSYLKCSACNHRWKAVLTAFLSIETSPLTEVSTDAK